MAIMSLFSCVMIIIVIFAFNVSINVCDYREFMYTIKGSRACPARVYYEAQMRNNIQSAVYAS